LIQGGHCCSQRDQCLSWGRWVSATPSTGKVAQKQSDASVAFAIRNDVVGRLPWLPQDIKETTEGTVPASSRIQIRHNHKYIRLLPITRSDGEKHKFYEGLQELLATVPKVVAPGYFNTRDGADHAAWAGLLGSCNGNLHLRSYATFHLLLTKIFRPPRWEKETWMHLNGHGGSRWTMFSSGGE
uniref:DAGKa domain-containing protein n=1 Tax=Schistocephalus solidus TaxID=70667 RepID=A0A183TIX5_SCHSO